MTDRKETPLNFYRASTEQNYWECDTIIYSSSGRPLSSVITRSYCIESAEQLTSRFLVWKLSSANPTPVLWNYKGNRVHGTLSHSEVCRFFGFFVTPCTVLFITRRPWRGTPRARPETAVPPPTKEEAIKQRCDPSVRLYVCPMHRCINVYKQKRVLTFFILLTFLFSTGKTTQITFPDCSNIGSVLTIKGNGI